MLLCMSFIKNDNIVVNNQRFYHIHPVYFVIVYRGGEKKKIQKKNRVFAPFLLINNSRILLQ